MFSYLIRIRLDVTSPENTEQNRFNNSSMPLLGYHLFNAQIFLIGLLEKFATFPSLLTAYRLPSPFFDATVFEELRGLYTPKPRET